MWDVRLGEATTKMKTAIRRLRTHIGERPPLEVLQQNPLDQKITIKTLRCLLDVLVCCLCVCVFKMFCPTFLFARFYSRWFPTRRSLLIRNRVPVSAGRLEAFSAQSPEKEWQSDQLREKWRGFSEVVWIAKRSNSELDVLIPFPKIWQKLDI